MKLSGFICPFLGALTAFGGTLFLLRLLNEPGNEWAGFLLKPGIAVADLIEDFTGSIALCVVAGILTMTLIGALFGAVIELLVGPLERTHNN